MSGPSSPAGLLGRTAVLNLAAFGTAALAALLVTPSVVAHLGDARYGAWSVVAELVGYSVLLDFGVRWAVGYFLVRHLAHDDRHAAERVLGTAAVVLGGVGVLVLALGAGMAAVFPALFDVPAAEVGEVRTAITILTTILGVGLPLELASAILYANRRMDLQSGVDIVCSVLTAIGFVIVVAAGGGLVALSLVQAASRAVGWTLRIGAVRRLPGRYRIDPRRAEWACVGELVRLGGRSFVMNVARLLFGRMQAVIIGAAVGLELVTRYRIGSVLADYLFAAVGAVSLAFTPHLAHLLAVGDREGARRLYLRATRFASLIALGLAALVLPLGTSFIGLWMGPQYVAGSPLARSDLVLAVLLLGMVPRFLQSVSWQLVTASGDLRFLMWIVLGESLASLALAWLLVGPYGPLGVAAASALPLLVTQTLVVPRYVIRRFEVEPRRYWAQGLARPLFAGAASLAVTGALAVAVAPRSWPAFLAVAAVAGLATLGLTLGPGLLPEDRRDLLCWLGVRQPQPDPS